ncbi:MAG TPA: LacI family transcriptional regulator, partial [Lachnospiraceae bacterium]|nr:LacI family transcriptional regulator [Lachnospiraceae bacterium]
MIGDYLTAHFSVTDLNQDGQIRYTFLTGDRNDSSALTLTQRSLDSANAALAGEGYRSLVYLDEEDTLGFQADPAGAWSSDAGTALIRSDLEFYNYANGNMIELIAAN